jgi:GNAT superfamily N-acetyltransferase
VAGQRRRRRGEVVRRPLAFAAMTAQTDWTMSASIPASGSASGSASDSHLVIRSAVAADCASILQFIRDLGEYERLSHEVVASEDTLRATLFGARPAAEVLIAEYNGTAAGFALFFHTYSTFLAKPGLYLEDLFVRPTHRRHGIATALMRRLARLAVARDCGRFEWSVLNWNQPALDFYRRIGAVSMSDWTVQRVTGEALLNLANAGR